MLKRNVVGLVLGLTLVFGMAFTASAETVSPDNSGKASTLTFGEGGLVAGDGNGGIFKPLTFGEGG